MTGHDPPCNDCRHYGRSVRDVVDTASWEILNDTHGIRETDCCHPSRSLRRRKTDATIVGEPTTEGLDVDHIPPLRA